MMPGRWPEMPNLTEINLHRIHGVTAEQLIDVCAKYPKLANVHLTDVTFADKRDLRILAERLVGESASICQAMMTVIEMRRMYFTNYTKNTIPNKP